MDVDDQSASRISGITQNLCLAHSDTAVTRKDGPLYKLSVNLINTYKDINKKYYERKKRQQIQEGLLYDDENRDYKVLIGEVLNRRYEVEAILGKGTFGRVVRAKDRETGELVAIKLIKNKTSFFNQGKIEIKILEHMNALDPEDNFFVVQMYGHFIHRQHLCIVFELLSINLYELLRNTKFQGVSLNLVQKFAYQLLTALYFLSAAEVGVIHCDLKPENCLLRNAKCSAIKVVDFGSSCREDNRMYKYIQSRFYRAPEVLLELEYGAPIDMWSLGCMLVELHTGEALFPGSNEVDQMARIAGVLGLPPEHMIEDSKKRDKFFEADKDGYKMKKSESKKPIRTKSLSEIIGVASGGPGGRRKGQPNHGMWNYLQFLDLVQGMLEYDPEIRMTPLEGLQHQFFTLQNE